MRSSEIWIRSLFYYLVALCCTNCLDALPAELSPRGGIATQRVGLGIHSQPLSKNHRRKEGEDSPSFYAGEVFSPYISYIGRRMGANTLELEQAGHPKKKAANRAGFVAKDRELWR